MSTLRKSFLSLAILSLALPSVLFAQSTANVTVTVNYANPRSTAIASDFEGYSFEIVDSEAANYGGVPWFNGTPSAMSTLMQTMGVKSFRFGGASMEEGASNTYPLATDGNNVNDFVNLVGANLIWGVPVGDARYNDATYTTYAENMISYKDGKGYNFHTVFEVGNEPDAIQTAFGGPVPLATVDSRFDSYLASFKSAIFPSISLGCCSPGSTESYDSNFEKDPTVVASKSNIGYVFAHNYPEGGADSYPNIAAAIDKMLSSGNNADYQNFYNSWAPSAIAAGFTPRMEETNSMYNGGFVGASDAFAASLWSLDYMAYLATQTQLAGMNFHGGGGGGYDSIVPPGPQSSYTPRGVAYGMLAFNQFSHGRPIPVTLSNPSNVNLTAYSVLQSDGSECVVIVNRTHSSSTATDVNATVTINSGNNYGNAQVMYLQQTNSDPTQTGGVTLGGQSMAGTGTWSGGYSTPTAISGGTYTVSVPYTSAAIIHFSGTASPNLIANGTYVITSFHSGLAIDDPGSSTTQGTDMQQYTVNNGTNQQWTLNNLGNNIVTLTNVASGQVLDVAGGTTASGALIDQYPYHSNPWQQWQVVSVGGGAYELMSVYSGLALDVIGGTQTVGAGLDQYAYGGNTWQKWGFNTP